MKKVIIIGCPGSGKSTFARKLKAVTGLPLYHLDMMYWNADKTTVEKAIFLDRLQNALAKPEWIIDGNYGSTMEMRLKVCDTVFFLDFPVGLCLKGVRERKGIKRSDMPWVEENTDAEFMAYIKEFNTEQRPGILALLKKYTDKKIFVFHTREDADVYLKEAEERG